MASCRRPLRSFRRLQPVEPALKDRCRDTRRIGLTQSGPEALRECGKKRFALGMAGFGEPQHLRKRESEAECSKVTSSWTASCFGCAVAFRDFRDCGSKAIPARFVSAILMAAPGVFHPEYLSNEAANFRASFLIYDAPVRTRCTLRIKLTSPEGISSADAIASGSFTREAPPNHFGSPIQIPAPAMGRTRRTNPLNGFFGLVIEAGLQFRYGDPNPSVFVWRAGHGQYCRLPCRPCGFDPACGSRLLRRRDFGRRFGTSGFCATEQCPAYDCETESFFASSPAGDIRVDLHRFESLIHACRKRSSAAL